MKLISKILKGTPARPPLTEYHPLDTTPAPVARGQCTATTQSGRQCRMPARPGTDRCTLPAHQKM